MVALRPVSWILLLHGVDIALLMNQFQNKPLSVVK